MQAVRAGNGFRLKGAKALVVDGHVADLLIVAARTAGAPGEREGLTLFLVDPKTRRASRWSAPRWSTPTTPRVLFSMTSR